MKEIKLDGYALVSQHIVMTEHLNANHHIFGGQLLAWLDKDLYVFISTKMRYKRLVTLGMNNVRFRKPAHLGEIIQIYGQIKQVKRSSVTANGKAVAFDPESLATREIIECEITFVALDEKGRPSRIFEQP